MIAAKTVPTTRVIGPRPMPIIGWTGNYVQYLRDPTGFVWSVYQRYGDLCALIEFTEDKKGMLGVFGAENIQQILTNPSVFHNSLVTVRAAENTALWWLGRSGLLSMNGEQHKQERRILMPAFHKKHIASYYDDIVAQTEKHLNTWKIGEKQTLYNEMFRLTQDISIKTLFGVDIPDNIEAIRAQFAKWMYLIPMADLVPINLPYMPYRRLMTASQALIDLFIPIIQQRRNSTTDNSDILSLLISSQREDGSHLTDNEILSEVNVFWNANESSSSVLMWTLFLLIEHPETLTALMEEFDTHLHGNPPTLEQVEQLPMLDHVIKESMRLFPPGNFLTTRTSTEPFEMGPYHLPTGTKITISPYVTHHMAQYFPDPNKFNPDRWKTINPSPYEYMPFGAGIHYCIGVALATLELKMILPMVLQRFRLSIEPNSSVDRYEHPILRAKTGIPVTVNAQDRNFVKAPVRGNVHEMVDL